jgi:hypothetical protein
MMTLWRFPTLPASVPPPTPVFFLSQPIIDVDMPLKFAVKTDETSIGLIEKARSCISICQTRSCIECSIQVESPLRSHARARGLGDCSKDIGSIIHARSLVWEINLEMPALARHV